MGYFIQKIFFTLGGLARWIYSLFVNIVFDKNYEKNIEYYLFEEKGIDKSGMNSNQKNFVLGIFMFILIISLIGYFESKR